MGDINSTNAVIDFFNENWSKYIRDTRSSGLVADHDPLISPIANMELDIDPVDGDIVVGGWQYDGPGHLILDVYLNLDYILDYPIDHHMVAREFLIPWIQSSFLKYFGFDIFVDFADIVIRFHTTDGAWDDYVVDAEETNVKPFYDNPPRYWKKVNRKISESVLSEGPFKTKSLYLTFPKKGWETIGGYLMKSLGVVTGVFNSAEQAIDVVRKKRKNIDPPLKELVIGSHGDGNHLLMSQGNKGLPVDPLLKEVRGLVGPDTTVFFTACYGADFLMQLCHASAMLDGNRVYGSAGIYNYIKNSSEKGYYSCQMAPRDYYDIQNDYEKRNLIFGSDKGNDYLIDRGFCKRESKAPINWVKNIWT